MRDEGQDARGWRVRGREGGRRGQKEGGRRKGEKGIGRREERNGRGTAQKGVLSLTEHSSEETYLCIHTHPLLQLYIIMFLRSAAGLLLLLVLLIDHILEAKLRKRAPQSASQTVQQQASNQLLLHSMQVVE